MSISVTIGQDTFSYSSGSSGAYWKVSASTSSKWSAKIGTTVPYSMYSFLFSEANTAGFSNHDFTRVRIPDIDSRVAAAALNVKPVRARIISDDSEPRVTVRKSNLTNSIKLF